MWIMWKKIEDPGACWYVGYLVREEDGYESKEEIYRFGSKGEAADQVHYLNGGGKR